MYHTEEEMELAGKMDALIPPGILINERLEHGK